MNELLTQTLAYFFKAIILALTGVITFYIKTVLVPWLQDKQIYTTVQRFVQAAEKLAEAGDLTTGPDKKSYVIRLLQSKNIEVTPEIEALIESAVEELDWMKGETFTTLIGEPDETASATDDAGGGTHQLTNWKGEDE